MVNQRYPESAGKTKTETMITIFTPTYNRAEFLAPLYDSIKNQSSKDLEWVIVDDGSTDNTHGTVAEIISSHDGSFPIRYFKKPNGGKHTAINMGVNVAEGELFFIVDSDDTIQPNCIETLSKYYNDIKDRPEFVGVGGLIQTSDKEQISKGVNDVTDASTIDMMYHLKTKGDFAEAYKVEHLKSCLFPEINGEKFCPEVLLWNRLTKGRMVRFFNKVIYNRDYLKGGLTDNIIKIRMHSPVASMTTYKELITEYTPMIYKIKNAINYWRFRFCYNPNHSSVKLEDIPKLKWYYNIFWPFGLIFHIKDLYITNKKNQNV